MRKSILFISFIYLTQLLNGQSFTEVMGTYILSNLRPKTTGIPLTENARIALAKNDEFMEIAKDYDVAGAKLEAFYQNAPDDAASLEVDGITVWIRLVDPDGNVGQFLLDGANEDIKEALASNDDADLVVPEPDLDDLELSVDPTRTGKTIEDVDIDAALEQEELDAYINDKI